MSAIVPDNRVRTMTIQEVARVFSEYEDKLRSKLRNVHGFPVLATRVYMAVYDSALVFVNVYTGEVSQQEVGCNLANTPVAKSS